MPDEQVRIDIVADDQASKPIDAVAKKLDKLEHPVEIPIEADTGAAERDVQGLLAKVDGLARDPASILLASNAASIAGDIATLIGDLDRLDANDPQVQIKVDQINALSGDLDSIEGKLKEIGGTPVAIDTRQAKQGLDDVAKSADSSKSVLANMVGNATQDLGALGGLAGSAGVAIGQMGEYMVDARASGDKLGSILKNFAGVAGPIAAIGLVTKLISDHFDKLAEDAKLADAQMKRFSASIADGADEAGVLRKELEATSELKFRVQIEGPDIDVGDITGPMRAAGVSIEEFIGLSKLSNEAFRAWADGAEAAGVSTKDLAAISLALAGYSQQMTTANENAANTAAALATNQASLRDVMLDAAIAERAHTDALDEQAAATAAAAEQSRKAAADMAKVEQATGRAEQAAKDMGREWDILTGKLDSEQAIADLSADFDDMREKGLLAWDAAVKGADDANAKQLEYQQSVRDAKDMVVDLGRQIGLSVPETKKMLLQIDDGAIDRVEEELRILTRNRTMEISIIARGGNSFSSAYAGGSQPRALPPAPAPATVINVTQHLPRGYRGDVLADASKAARRTGGLYQRNRR